MAFVCALFSCYIVLFNKAPTPIGGGAAAVQSYCARARSDAHVRRGNGHVGVAGTETRWAAHNTALDSTLSRFGRVYRASVTEKAQAEES